MSCFFKQTALFTFIYLTLASQALGLDIGDEAANIVGRDIKGGLFSLSRANKKPKVVNFFWVECMPCKKEIPLLANKESLYPNVEFIVVHTESNPKTGSNYNIQDIQLFIETLNKAPEQVVLASPRVKTSFGIKGFPHSVLLSADNKIEDILVGFNNKTIAKLEAWLANQ